MVFECCLFPTSYCEENGWGCWKMTCVGFSYDHGNGLYSAFISEIIVCVGETKYESGIVLGMC